uniref:Uncharacterized protein n=1 Tax=Glossina morsitans morsitans TaxID=37546 RepID=A0A1B0GB05_GLOMM
MVSRICGSSVENIVVVVVVVAVIIVVAIVVLYREVGVGIIVCIVVIIPLLLVFAYSLGVEIGAVRYIRLREGVCVYLGGYICAQIHIYMCYAYLC